MIQAGFMKGFRSIISGARRFNLSDRFNSQSNVLRLVLVIVAILLVILSNSYSPKIPMGSQADASLTQQKQLEVADIEDNITNSYARLAAKRADICPKLLQKNMGNNDIKRVAEVMVNDYCDYFLYLEAGQRINVDVDNRQIEALLVVPTMYDFANGEYQVTSYDKHVIRLAYNGATYKPERLSYDVAITVTD